MIDDYYFDRSDPRFCDALVNYYIINPSKIAKLFKNWRKNDEIIKKLIVRYPDIIKNKIPQKNRYMYFLAKHGITYCLKSKPYMCLELAMPKMNSFKFGDCDLNIMYL